MVIWIVQLSETIKNKNYAPKLRFISEKKIEKDSDDFWHKKIDFEGESEN